jgi:tRNA threonylcarbamoyl adenosine modification protein (Sua5/YciO/YrdC/YwlC family)
MPTDTVYGVAADAFNPNAVALLLAAKGRGRSMPAPVLIHKPDAIQGVGADISPEVWALIREFWPGALTVIVHQQPTVPLDLGDAMGTVAVRMPNDDLALDLLALTGPLAVSSANRTGHPSARSADEAQEQLAESIDIYINDGPRAESGEPSTIVDATGDILRVVRQGALPLEKLREVVPSILGMGETAPETETAGEPEAEPTNAPDVSEPTGTPVAPSVPATDAEQALAAEAATTERA